MACAASRSGKVRARCSAAPSPCTNTAISGLPEFGQTGGTSSIPAISRTRKTSASFWKNWREAAVGRNRHKDRLLTHGAKYTPIKVTNAEAQLLETEKRATPIFSGCWSFPPHRPRAWQARPITTSSSNRSISCAGWRRSRSRSSRRPSATCCSASSNAQADCRIQFLSAAARRSAQPLCRLYDRPPGRMAVGERRAARSKICPAHR
jgi:hypothetical protein